ncbi:hypothetical protein ACSQ67_010500 [Phaseolus vulgaris]
MSIFFSSPSPAMACTLFQVGGKDGWVLNPSQDYTHWAQRNRFQVNDTLFFKYRSGSDSVLVVKKEDYDSCNTNNAIQEMDGGDSKFTFVKSGPFFFISGNAQNCQRGQKLTVVVLAVRQNKHTHSLSPSATPSPAEAEIPSENGPSPSSDVSPSGPTSLVPSLPKHSSSTRFRSSVGVALGVVSVGVGFFFIPLG